MLSFVLSGGLAFGFLKAKDKALFMPGPLSFGHHQLAEACDTCHSDPFAGAEALEQACLRCHGQERIKPLDSHPKSKFEDPRNAEHLAKIDAVHCVTCHSEHRPQITQKDGLTQPRDVCFHCHQDIAKERPSHAGMAFSSCKDSGCHNFHDNQALYTDFLIKHLDEPETLASATVPPRQFSQILAELGDYPHQRFPVRPLTLAEADFPAGQGGDAQIQRDWAETAHTRSGVNCSACHGQGQSWNEHPDHNACAQCHGIETKAFGQGRHGMRLAAGLSPMTPAKARLPMRPEAQDNPLTCTACHTAHRFDTVQAAAKACLGCHADDHSLAWKDSAHAELWRRELAGELPPGSGVTCATCHMPRIAQEINDWQSRIVVQHNQSAVHSPNSKMLRPVCLQCHGLAFSLDALADAELIRRNFKGRPKVHVQSLELARAERERRARTGQGDTHLFGF
ncbi:MAG: cytochrome c3 family protein [Methylohalobius sp.]